MKKDKLDAIVAPSNAPTWMTDWGERQTAEAITSRAHRSRRGVAGYPSIHGAGRFSARASDRALVHRDAIHRACADPPCYAFEQMTKARRKPKFLVTAQ
jgi:hypothetical protein